MAIGLHLRCTIDKHRQAVQRLHRIIAQGQARELRLLHARRVDQGGGRGFIVLALAFLAMAFGVPVALASADGLATGPRHVASRHRGDDVVTGVLPKHAFSSKQSTRDARSYPSALIY